jgi:hypothetical protein
MKPTGRKKPKKNAGKTQSRVSVAGQIKACRGLALHPGFQLFSFFLLLLSLISLLFLL